MLVQHIDPLLRLWVHRQGDELPQCSELNRRIDQEQLPERFWVALQEFEDALQLLTHSRGESCGAQGSKVQDARVLIHASASMPRYERLLHCQQPM